MDCYLNDTFGKYSSNFPFCPHYIRHVIPMEELTQGGYIELWLHTDTYVHSLLILRQLPNIRFIFNCRLSLDNLILRYILQI